MWNLAGRTPSSHSTSLEHISAPYWQLATSSLLDRPKPMYCGNWPVARPLGGYFGIVHFLLFVASLSYLSAGTHYDLLRSDGRSTSALVLLNHHASGVAVVGTTRLPM